MYCAPNKQTQEVERHPRNQNLLPLRHRLCGGHTGGEVLRVLGERAVCEKAPEELARAEGVHRDRCFLISTKRKDKIRSLHVLEEQGRRVVHTELETDAQEHDVAALENN
jgi:hypothetical protein